ncbi:MAG: MFS transporter [Clostridiales bacterium]
MTNKATSATLVTLFTFLPAFILRPIGGVFADRIDRRLLMFFGNIGSSFGIFLVIIMMSPSKENLWMIYPGIAVSSIFYAFQNPAYKASVSDFFTKRMLFNILAYGFSGILADKLFNPMFMPDGILANSFGKVFGIGQGRGIAFIFFLSGIFVILLSFSIYKSKAITALDFNEDKII